MSKASEEKREKRSISAPVKKDNESKLYEQYIAEEFAKQFEIIKASILKSTKQVIGVQHIKNLAINITGEVAARYQTKFIKRFKNARAFHSPDELPENLQDFFNKFVHDMRDLKSIEFDNLILIYDEQNFLAEHKFMLDLENKTYNITTPCLMIV